MDEGLHIIIIIIYLKIKYFIICTDKLQFIYPVKNCTTKGQWEVDPILLVLFFQLMFPVNRRHNIMICDREYIVYCCLTVVQLEIAFLMRTLRPRLHCGPYTNNNSLTV